MFWKFKTKQRMVFRIMYVSLVGIHRNHDYRPSFKATTLRWDWSLPISVPGFFMKKLPSWKLFLLVAQIWRRKKNMWEHATCFLQSWHVGQSAKCRCFLFIRQANKSHWISAVPHAKRLIALLWLLCFLATAVVWWNCGTPSPKLMGEKVLRWLDLMHYIMGFHL